MDRNKSQKEIDDLNKVSGKINFKEKRSKYFLKVFIKWVAFFTIATISGGLAGGYISSKQATTYVYPPTNNYPPEKIIKVPSLEHEIIAQSDIIKAVDEVSPSIAGVYLEESNQNISNGIIFKANGYIITSYRNIKGNSRIMVILPNDDNKLVANLIGFDEPSDIAIIKIEGENFPIAKFGDSTKVNIGDTVIAIGNTLNKQQVFGTITSGIISTINRSVEIEDVVTKNKTAYSAFLTDAFINQGNSGGPLCNLSGEMIGINGMKLGRYEGKIDGLGFSLNISNITKIIDTIMDVGHGVKLQLGVKVTKAVLEDKTIKGIYVKDVVSGTGADAAGIKPTDIIIEVDGEKVINVQSLNLIISKHKVADKVQVKIWRNTKLIDKEVQLTKQQDNNS